VAWQLTAEVIVPPNREGGSGTDNLIEVNRVALISPPCCLPMLDVVNHRHGVLSDVKTAQRIDARGGAGQGTCDQLGSFLMFRIPPIVAF